MGDLLSIVSPHSLVHGDSTNLSPSSLPVGFILKLYFSIQGIDYASNILIKYFMLITNIVGINHNTPANSSTKLIYLILNVLEQYIFIDNFVRKSFYSTLLNDLQKYCVEIVIKDKWVNRLNSAFE